MVDGKLKAGWIGLGRMGFPMAERLAKAGVNLTKIESRPVMGSPWEYVFYVDVRFDTAAQAEAALAALREHCRMVKVLGRYRAA